MTITTAGAVSDDVAIPALRETVGPLKGEAKDYNPLLELIGEARFVLLGEASHGMHEFYRERAQITKRLSLLCMRGDDRVASLRLPRLQRAIGVIYRPETERASHYFHASLPQQFDAVLHFDRKRAVEPLERAVMWEESEVPETFPSGV
jgi:erythromycin esterase-like protein